MLLASGTYSNMVPQVAGSFNKAMACNGKPEVYGPLTECCSKMLQWMMYKERETADVRTGILTFVCV